MTGILSTKFEQPFFGANYLVIDIKPSPGGGLSEGTKAEIRLKDKGLFEFVSSLEKTRERAIYMRRSSCDEEEGLRKCHCACGLYPILTLRSIVQHSCRPFTLVHSCTASGDAI